MSVYTRTGDKGETSLVSGNRVSKSSARINLYGDVDELNCYIGFLVSNLSQEKYEDTLLLLNKVQHSLFDLGSNLACEKENREKYKLPQLNSETVSELEKSIDKMEEVLPKLKNFVLPGGAIAASAAHICRTFCRRVERELVEYQSENGETPHYSIEFLNRLSDYFFVLSRYINFQENHKEVLWAPKK